MAEKVKNPLIIGLTGSIAAGKSEVAACFAKLGADIVCADMLAKQALKPGSSVYKKIAKKFGKEALHPDGSVCREFIAKKVFSDAKLKKWLEMQVHPIVIIESLEAFRRTNRSIVVFDAPLLFEAGAQDMCDVTVCVCAQRSVRLERAKRRDWSRAEFAAREKSQFPESRKAALADVIIENSGSKTALAAKITKLYRALNSLAIGGPRDRN